VQKIKRIWQRIDLFSLQVRLTIGTTAAFAVGVGGIALWTTWQMQQILIDSKTFKSDMGPDLPIILHRDATLPKGGLKKPDYVTLSRLQKVSGTQRYVIPNNVNLANFRTVAVWCRMFNATFGYALLPATSTAQP
jgi:hypothetical protein